jgi:hypothetical protein
MKRFLLLFLLCPGIALAQNSASGNITASDASCTSTTCVSIPRLYGGTDYVVVTLSGTFSATLQFEQSGDFGVTWVSANPAWATIPGSKQFKVSGFSSFRVRASTYVSGTVVVTILTHQSGTGSGDGVSTNGLASSQNVIYISISCGTQTNCFISPLDTKQDVTCSWTKSTTTLTCSDSPFTAADVGKNIVGFDTCKTTLAILAVNSIGARPTTITALTGPTQVTLSAVPTAAQGAATGCIFYGHPDDMAFAAADAAAVAAKTCPKVQMSAGIAWLVEPHFYTITPACSIDPKFSGISYLTWGFELAGQGPSVTTLFLPPYFDLAACSAIGSKVCFGGWNTTATGFYFHDFGITGGGYSGNGVVTTAYITGFGQSLGTIKNFNCSNFAARAANVVGVHQNTSYHNYLTNVDIDGCGAIGLQVGNGVLVAYAVSVDDSYNIQLYVQTGATYQDTGGASAFQPSIQSLSGSTQAVIRNDGGSVAFTNGGGVFPNSYANQMNGYLGINDSALYANHASFTMVGASRGTSLRLDNSSIAALRDTGVSSGGSVGGVLLNGATPTSVKFTDLGGNSIPNFRIINGTVFGDLSIMGTLSATGNWALTSGWGTSTTRTFTGQTKDGGLTITLAGSPTTGAVLTFTFPTPFYNTPSHCKFELTGGTQMLTSVNTTSISASTVAYTFNGSLAADNTIIGYSSCGNQ